jgi:hypothetical protein
MGRKYGTSGSDVTLANGKKIITVNNSKSGHSTCTKGRCATYKLDEEYQTLL